MHGDQTRSESFYDRAGVRDRYLAHRHAPVTSPNMTMEEPAFLHAIGDLTGASILDLGCGDGTFAAQALGLGATRYLGIDSSNEMVALAERRHGSDVVRFERADLSELDGVLVEDDDRFDLVSARMVLHYIDDVDSVLSTIARHLQPAAKLVFTVAHPVITSARDLPIEASGRRETQIVDDYFAPGARRRSWFGGEVRWVHRTIEHYVDAVHRAGLTLTGLSECEPVESLFAGNHAEYERRRRVPLMLLLAAEPPSEANA